MGRIKELLGLYFRMIPRRETVTTRIFIYFHVQSYFEEMIKIQIEYFSNGCFNQKVANLKEDVNSQDFHQDACQDGSQDSQLLKLLRSMSHLHAKGGAAHQPFFGAALGLEHLNIYIPQTP